jgi:hypothetical protein
MNQFGRRRRRCHGDAATIDLKAERMSTVGRLSLVAASIAALLTSLALATPTASAKKPRPGTTTTTVVSTTTSISTTTSTIGSTTTTTTTTEPATTTEPVTTIVYSDRYLRYIALAPSGWASNACEGELLLSGTTGVCTAEFDPVWMYPDGSWGKWPWYLDPTSATGWSIDTPCDDPNVVAYDDWYVYVEWYNYGLYQDPGLTDEQIAASGVCYGWWW